MSGVLASEVFPTIKAALFQCFTPLVGLDQDGIPAVYWQRSRLDAPKPLIIFQSQDRGGAMDGLIGGSGWNGLITVRAYADTDDDADALCAAIESALATLPQPSDYTLSVVDINPLPLFEANVSVVGLSVRLSLYRA